MYPLDYILGYVLDLSLGDPPSWPHPVRWIGNEIDFLLLKIKSFFPQGKQQVWGGILLWFAVVTSTGLTVYLVSVLSWKIGRFPGHLVTIYLVYGVLATRSLHDESARVFRLLESGDLIQARARLKYLVSRNTEHLSESQIMKALLETISENINDGIVAPMFYLVLGGPVLAWMYKAASTLDSMVGYKNEEFLLLGKFSARADDILNYFPARISGLGMILASFLCGLDWANGWRIWKRDSKKHASPNAGIPEAVLAGALGVQLGGPGSYFGKLVDKTTLGDSMHNIDCNHYNITIRILYVTSLILFFAGFISVVVKG